MLRAGAESSFIVLPSHPDPPQGGRNDWRLTPLPDQVTKLVEVKAEFQPFTPEGTKSL